MFVYGPVLATYKRPQLGQGTHERCLWDGWAPGVNINDWGIVCGWWNRQGVKCEDKLGAIEKTGWSKVNSVGIIKWRGGDVSWQSIQIITISISDYDTRQCFDDNETIGPTMRIHINERSLKPLSLPLAWNPIDSRGDLQANEEPNH